MSRTGLTGLSSSSATAAMGCQYQRIRSPMRVPLPVYIKVLFCSGLSTDGLSLFPVTESHRAAGGRQRPIARDVIEQVEFQVLAAAGDGDPVEDLGRAAHQPLARQGDQLLLVLLLEAFER